jgi:hypothetical protein
MLIDVGLTPVPESPVLLARGSRRTGQVNGRLLGVFGTEFQSID